MCSKNTLTDCEGFGTMAICLSKCKLYDHSIEITNGHLN